MSLSANARINKHFDTEDARSNIASGAVFSGNATSKASLSALGAGVSAVYKPVFPYYVRAGVEYIHSKVAETTDYSSQYSYSISVDEVSISRQGIDAKSSSTVKSYKNVLPLVGIGVEFPVGQNFSLRLEYERVGVIKWGFDFYSLSLLARF
jgi:opacity protein-like surface antigen